MREQYDEEREKKNKENHLHMNSKVCTVTKAVLYIFTFLQVLMWMFFELKCAKLNTFCILPIFATIDVIALIGNIEFKLFSSKCVFELK